MCLVLRINGADGKYQWCEPSARHVRSTRTWVDVGKKGVSKLL
ncbi:hypothetical protein ABVC73_10680 [Prevotella melaninogenica]